MVGMHDYRHQGRFYITAGRLSNIFSLNEGNSRGGGAITRYYKSGYAGICAQKNSFSPEQIRTLVGLRFAMRPAAVGDATDSPPFAIRLCFGVQLAQEFAGFRPGIFKA